MWRLEWADSMPPLALRSLLVQPISSKIRICRPILAAVSDEKSTTRGGDTVLNQLPASTPDGITTKLIDAISCLSNVSDLLIEGADIFDSYVRHWLVSVSDDLIGLALDIRPGEVRYELLLMLAAILLSRQSYGRRAATFTGWINRKPQLSIKQEGNCFPHYRQQKRSDRPVNS
jgi:hypothetical protein